MPLVYLETPRFTIRQWHPGDARQLFQLMSDPRVHLYTRDAPWTLERARNYIQLMLQKDFRTLEVFHGACLLKGTAELIGFTGLNPYLPKAPELEWQFGLPYWGRGYATEIGRAVIQAAFETTPIECIYGIVDPRHQASLRVMQKIGMACLGLQPFRGGQYVFYRVERQSLRG
jgi:ribosomal-protein-alanine N-acetyltransferase